MRPSTGADSTVPSCCPTAEQGWCAAGHPKWQKMGLLRGFFPFYIHWESASQSQGLGEQGRGLGPSSAERAAELNKNLLMIRAVLSLMRLASFLINKYLIT